MIKTWYTENKYLLNFLIDSVYFISATAREGLRRRGKKPFCFFEAHKSSPFSTCLNFQRGEGGRNPFSSSFPIRHIRFIHILLDPERGRQKEKALCSEPPHHIFFCSPPCRKIGVGDLVRKEISLELSAPEGKQRREGGGWKEEWKKAVLNAYKLGGGGERRGMAVNKKEREEKEGRRVKN